MPKGPLTGIRVIELGQIAAGSFAESLFADLGANAVITVTMMGSKNILGYSGQFIYISACHSAAFVYWLLP